MGRDAGDTLLSPEPSLAAVCVARSMRPETKPSLSYLRRSSSYSSSPSLCGDSGQAGYQCGEESESCLFLGPL